VIFPALLAAATIVATLDADVRAVAALRGEPHMVGAAGYGRDGAPLATIENPSPFDPAEQRRRVVVIGRGANNDAAARGVIEVVRWFKSAAPAAIRKRWLLSALPVADIDAPHVLRWIDFRLPTFGSTSQISPEMQRCP